MRKKILISAILFLAINIVNAQVNLLTEDFETDGEGSRYTSNNFDTGCHDFFERYSNGGGNCLTTEPTNASGSFYWAGEDVDAASGGTGITTLNALTVTGYNLEMQVLVAIGRPDDFRLEPTDELLFQYNMDGGGWVTFGAFYGTNDGNTDAAINGNLGLDADLDGFHDGLLEVSSPDFTDWTFPIPVTGNSLQVRFIFGQDTGTEEIMIDNIRINSTPALPIALSEFSLNEMEKGALQINWQTASELNNEYFIIERSKDLVTWEEITKIDGAGNSNEALNYNTIDNNPYQGFSYYRLKQVDFDGKFSYSAMESVNMPYQYHEAVSIYPNPARHEITIDGNEEEFEKIQIINSLGQSVANLLTINQISESQIKVDVSRLSSGIYFLKTKNTSSKIYVGDTP